MPTCGDHVGLRGPAVNVEVIGFSGTDVTGSPSIGDRNDHCLGGIAVTVCDLVHTLRDLGLDGLWARQAAAA
jgi:hypothetical protein